MIFHFSLISTKFVIFMLSLYSKRTVSSIENTNNSQGSNFWIGFMFMNYVYYAIE